MSSNLLLKPRGAGWRLAIVGAGIVAALAVASTTVASAEIFGLSPEADTYVLESSAGSNFGTLEDLDVSSHLAGPNHKNKRTLLRFDLSDLNDCTITSASLRLTAFDISGKAVGRTYNLHHTTDNDDDWVESGGTGVTWSSMPVFNGTATTFAVVPANNTLPVDMFWNGLEILVTSELSGNQLLSLLVKDSTESQSPGNAETLFYSREAAEDDALKPRLVIDATCNSTTIEPGDFRTQTQGGWGTAAHGNNPGVYRDANFISCFPTGAVIGDAQGYSVLFTSSLAVETFLPQGSTPGVLSQDDTDPTSTDAGVLAGQVLALLLSVEFDMCDADFGASTENLANLVVNDPTNETVCDGMTVQEVLNTANDIISGVPSDPTPSEINECVDKINNNFVDGTAVGGYLKLP